MENFDQQVGATRELGENPLYSDSRSAVQTVRDDYLYWTQRLTDGHIQLSVGLIGANWAVFNSINGILNNNWSAASVAVVIVSLVVNLLGIRRMAELHRARIAYAESDPSQWQREFEESLQQKATAWPFTPQIEHLARILRECRTWLPVVSGMLFLAGLLFRK